MLKILCKYKTKTSHNSPFHNNKISKFSKNKTFIKNIKKTGVKTRRSNTNRHSNNIHNILNFEKNLKKKEKDFEINVTNKILLNKNLSKKIFKNISLLENKILDNYDSLKSSNYNIHKTNNYKIQSLYEERRRKNINNEYNKQINELKLDIDKIENKIEKYNNLTGLYKRNYYNLNEQVIKLKNESKILPGIINNLENENKNLSNSYNKINSDIIKIKYKLIELEKNKRNIKMKLIQCNKLYK